MFWPAEVGISVDLAVAEVEVAFEAVFDVFKEYEELSSAFCEAVGVTFDVSASDVVAKASEARTFEVATSDGSGEYDALDTSELEWTLDTSAFEDVVGT